MKINKEDIICYVNSKINHNNASALFNLDIKNNEY